MELTPPTAILKRFRYAVCGLGVLGAVATGQERRDRNERELVIPPPPCVPQEMKVARGEEVVIPLKIYGARNQQLTFLIRRPPQTGVLSAMKYTTANSAIIHYRSTKDLNVRSDIFEYAVKSSEGVSAAVPVKIEIVDEPPELFGPAEVLFPPQLTGTRQTQTIELINRGGMVAEGECGASAPFHLEGAPNYRVVPGGRVFVKVAFEPEKAGDFLGELRLSSQPQLSVILRGIAQDALALKPASLRLSPDAVTRVRTGVFEVTNNTGAAQVVRVTSNERLYHEPQMRLGAGQTAPLMVRTRPEDAQALEAEILLEAGGNTARLPVSAPALPAIIGASERLIDLGLVPSGTPAFGKFTLRNSGGATGWATITAQRPFRLDPTRVDLEPGATAEVGVTLEPGGTGTIEQSLQLRTSSGFAHVPVRAVVVAPGSMPARSSSGSSPLSTLEKAPPSTPMPLNAYDLDLSRPDSRLLVRPVVRESNQCVLEWHIELSGAKKFIAQRRELQIDGERLLVRWVPMPGFSTEHLGERVRGRFEKLLPGRRYNVRVLEDTGERQTQIFETSFQTPLPGGGGRKAGLWATVGLVVAGAVAFVLWKGGRIPGRRAAALKKTQRIF